MHLPLRQSVAPTDLVTQTDMLPTPPLKEEPGSYTFQTASISRYASVHSHLGSL